MINVWHPDSVLYCCVLYQFIRHRPFFRTNCVFRSDFQISLDQLEMWKSGCSFIRDTHNNVYTTYKYKVYLLVIGHLVSTFLII